MGRPGTVITVYSQHYSTCEGRNLIIFPITWHIVRRIKVIIKKIACICMFCCRLTELISINLLKYLLSIPTSTIVYLMKNEDNGTMYIV